MFLRFKNDLFLASNFLQFPGWNRLEFLPFLEHSCFCSKNFEPNCDDSPMYILGLQCDPHDAWVEIVPLVVLWIRDIPLFNHWGPVVMHSPDAPVAKSFLCSVFYKSKAGAILNFPFSPRILHRNLIFFVARINEVNSSQLSSILQFWFFNRPFLFLSILSGFSNSVPYFRPHMIWPCRCLSLCQSPVQHVSFGKFLF